MSAREQRAKQRELNKTDDQDDTVNNPISASENEKKAELSKTELGATRDSDTSLSKTELLGATRYSDTSGSDDDDGSDDDGEPPPLLGPDDDFKANIEKRMKSITALVTSFSKKVEDGQKELAAVKSEFTEKLAVTNSTFKTELDGHKTNFTKLFVAQDTKVNAVADDVVKSVTIAKH